MSKAKKIALFIIGLLLAMCITVTFFATAAIDSVIAAEGGAVAVDEINFPDPGFRDYVKNKIDTDGDGTLSEDEISAATVINVRKYGISDLTGIQYLSELSSLDCSYNNLTKLDVSKNALLTDLECTDNDIIELDVSGAASLTKLDCSYNKMTALDVSGAASLTNLDCSFNELTALDVSDNAALKVLSFRYNNVTALDVSKNSALTDLDCRDNALTALDVSKNTSLTDLDCFGNDLTVLDVSKNTSLIYLDCSYNNLTALDVSLNSKLTYLSCYFNKLTELDVTNNSRLTTLQCYNNILTKLDVSKNSRLDSLDCSSNSLLELDLSQNNDIYYLDYCDQKVYIEIDGANSFDLSSLQADFNKMSNITVDGGILAEDGKTVTLQKDIVNVGYDYVTGFNPLMDVHLILYRAGAVSDVKIDAANFPDEIFRDYVATEFDIDSDGVLSVKEYLAVTKINVSDEGVSDLTGIQNFIYLSDLDCSYNDLTALDVSKNTSLTDLDCSYNDLTALDVSKNTSLTDLNCYNNRLTALDVSKNTSLTDLNCYNNRLTALDVSKNTSLTDLNCYNNRLTALDVSQNTSLTDLNCYNNRLTALDVSQNTSLTDLYCYNNRLTALDVSKNTSLTDLNCSDNRLTALDVSANKQLAVLSCASNALTELNVQGCSNLRMLGCSYNKLTELDVSTNSALFHIVCSGNAIINLDLSNNFGLWMAVCDQVFAYEVPAGADSYKVEMLSEYKDKISDITVIGGTLSSDGGKVKLEKDFVSVSYKFDTGNTAGEMNVTLLLYAEGTLSDIAIDAVNFPDRFFRQYISDNFDADNDGVLSVEERAEAFLIDLSHCEIYDLTGIEHFFSLMCLDCDYCCLTELDVSKNSALGYFYCDYQMLVKAVKPGTDTIDISSLFTDWSKVTDVTVSGGEIGEDGKTLTFTDDDAIVQYKYPTGYGDKDMTVVLELIKGYSVTVIDGEIEGTIRSVSVVRENESVTVIADTSLEDGEFIGWSNDGGATIISTDATYTLTVTEDVTLTAVYKDIPSTVKPPEEKGAGLSGGAIAGIVIGSVLVALAAVYGVCAVLFKKGIIKGAFFNKIYPFIK